MLKGKTIQSQMPCHILVEEPHDEDNRLIPRHDAWLNKDSINVTLSISADESFLCDVKGGYLEDKFAKKLTAGANQCLWYYVQWNQKGWVVALPLIQFQIMNSVNGSTGYSGFQLLMGRLPRLRLPLLATTDADHSTESDCATELIERIKWDVEDAKDHLLEAKCMQAFYTNRDHGEEDVFKIGDKVMLSTLHCRREFTANDPSCIAKFIPCFDGPYNIVNSMPEFLAYTLDLPNVPNIFLTFHLSQLKCFTENDASLFLSHKHARPGPIMTPEGLEEYAIERILDE